MSDQLVYSIILAAIPTAVCSICVLLGLALVRLNILGWLIAPRHNGFVLAVCLECKQCCK